MFLIFSAVLVLMFIGVTTAVTMGFASIATFLFAGGDVSRLFLVPQRMFAQVSGITLMSIPFFLLMGNLMSVGGISKSLFGFGRVCLGHRWGGLSNAAIAASIVMAAMSGSAAACAAGIGMIAISEMTRAGYSRSFSCATIAAGGALGPIIPPSITLILYAGLTQTSVNALFEAGAIPGLLLGFAFMAWSSFVSYKNNYAKEGPSPYSARWQAFKDAFFALLTPVIWLVHFVNRPFEGKEEEEDTGAAMEEELDALASMAREAKHITVAQELAIQQIPDLRRIRSAS